MKSALIYNFHTTQALPTYSYLDTGVSNQEIVVNDEVDWASFQDFLTKLEANISLAVNVNFSGSFLSQLQNNKVELERVQHLVEKGRIDIIGSPYYNSLSCLFSKELFEHEINKQTDLLEQLFAVKPSGFMNAALLFDNSLASILHNQGFSYTLVPKIEWFVPRGSNEKIFRSTKSDIRLVLAQFNQDEETDFNVIIVNGSELPTENSKGKMKGEGVTLSDQILSNNNNEIYSLPDLVAEHNEGGTLELLIGNNLQKDFLRRIQELSVKITHAKNDELKENLLWLGSAHHFQLISGNIESVKRYNNYTILQNLLYDLDLKLRQC